MVLRVLIYKKKKYEETYGKIPTHCVIINEESLPYLIEEGVIKEVEEEGTHVDPNFYLEHLAKRILEEPMKQLFKRDGKQKDKV